jgi:hypothetical protein
VSRRMVLVFLAGSISAYLLSAQLKNLDVQRFLVILAPILLDRGCQYLANEKTGRYQEP